MFIFDSTKKDHLHISHCCEDQPQLIRYDKHLHENFELLLFIRGDATYNIDGQNYPLLPYDLVFIPSLSYHFVTFESYSVYENYVINFSRDFVEEERISKLFIPPFIKNISNADKLRRMFSNFDFYHETYSSSDFEEASRYLLKEILLLSCYTSFEKENLLIPSEQSVIPAIISYISRNLESELNADIIADKLRFSKSYIKNCFSSVMGIGIQHYINQKKIHAAHLDLINGMEINRTAEKYGYCDYSSFYRQFTKIIGMTPSQVKKQTNQ